MRKSVAVALLALLLSGCVTADDQMRRMQEAQARLHEECAVKRGYKPGTQEYGMCQQAVAMTPDPGAMAGSMAAGIGFGILGAMLSDARAKEDIWPVGEADGLTLYCFRYKGESQRWVGVLAQEVEEKKPEAVVRGTDGLLRVRYASLGFTMVRWEDWAGPSH